MAYIFDIIGLSRVGTLLKPRLFRSFGFLFVM